MTGRMLIIDDRTGHRIPAGAKYYAVQAWQGGATMRTYRDVSSVAGVIDEVRVALRTASESPHQHVSIEIHERTA